MFSPRKLNFYWTDAEEKLLIKLRAQGLSASQIAIELGKLFPPTRKKNAIIGKASRMQLPLPQSKARIKSAKQVASEREKATRLPNIALTNMNNGKGAQRAQLYCPTVVLSASEVLARFKPQQFGRISNCQWPIGDPGHPSFHFCNAKSELQRPYCAEHSKLAYIKPSSKE